MAVCLKHVPRGIAVQPRLHVTEAAAGMTISSIQARLMLASPELRSLVE